MSLILSRNSSSDTPLSAMLVQDAIHDQAMEEQASEKAIHSSWSAVIYRHGRRSIWFAALYFERPMDATNQFIISEVSPEEGNQESPGPGRRWRRPHFDHRRKPGIPADEVGGPRYVREPYRKNCTPRWVFKISRNNFRF